MSCYSPLLGVWSGSYTENGKKDYRVVSKVNNLTKDVLTYPYAETVLIPCGKCVGCRLDKARQWADRMTLEFDHSKKAVFLTLTYDDDYLPVSDLGFPTLLKSDLQTFMKDLRGNKYYESKELRFYGSGEYGSKPVFGSSSFRYGRPHLHVIVFGVGLDDFTDEGYIGPFRFPDFYVGNTSHKLYYDGQNELHQPHYRSPHLDNVVWKKGRCCVAEFSWSTAAYTARYVRKKLDGQSSWVYDELGIQPPFALMSRRPGIGSLYFYDHPEIDPFELVGFCKEGKIHRWPKNIEKTLEGIDLEKYNQLKADRKKYATDSLLLELQNTDLSLSEYYEVKRQDFINRTKILDQRLE